MKWTKAKTKNTRTNDWENEQANEKEMLSASGVVSPPPLRSTPHSAACYLGSIIASLEIVCEEKPRARLPSDHDKWKKYCRIKQETQTHRDTHAFIYILRSVCTACGCGHRDVRTIRSVKHVKHGKWTRDERKKVNCSIVSSWCHQPTAVDANCLYVCLVRIVCDGLPVVFLAWYQTERHATHINREATWYT